MDSSSMLPRVLETEVMDSLEEAVDYDSMDHGEVNRRFVADLLVARSELPPSGVGQREMLDLGTGTALIPLELCRQQPTARVVAVDAAKHMIALARRHVEAAGLADRVRLAVVDAKRLPYADGRFCGVISNSIVHHVPEPRRVLDEAWRVTARGGLLFFRDLLRPADDETVRHLVQTYAGDANRHQQQMFEESLRAALTAEEMAALVAAYGCEPATVQATSDRHWTWVGRKG